MMNLYERVKRIKVGQLKMSHTLCIIQLQLQLQLKLQLLLLLQPLESLFVILGIGCVWVGGGDVKWLGYMIT